ncbi:hypothetical protein PPERSA_00500 [Pseudocohnilembus persalinus]|uniref:Prolyl 4-hydroxylase alpha subunit domain-containing protein n=1 Tax=Pseudocohnilembus persalinus TaxID=266149 RepID=A0A0V0R8U2_PSEPJ|nr:hypothetical protein PPERSA_00500 [Pseudocohnilembus persalinus]|eukprot:KRX10730.1 hypothetical protein PPERSA_00500 [Pseudocohnilembus persalinus]
MNSISLSPEQLQNLTISKKSKLLGRNLIRKVNIIEGRIVDAQKQNKIYNNVTAFIVEEKLNKPGNWLTCQNDKNIRIQVKFKNRSPIYVYLEDQQAATLFQDTVYVMGGGQQFRKKSEFGEILYIDNYFSDQLCDQLVEQVNKLGFIDAPLTVGIGKGVMDKSVRDCQRVMVDDFQVAELLYKQFLNYAPLCCEGAYMWGVNERFRYLYYNQNGIFKAHYDGRYPSNIREFSMFTVHFYLNTVEKGGGTSFYSDKWNQPKVVDSIKGRVAIFRQNEWLHQGDKVEIGEKYTVRNELMYRLRTQVCIMWLFYVWKKLQIKAKMLCL